MSFLTHYLLITAKSCFCVIPLSMLKWAVSFHLDKEKMAKMVLMPTSYPRKSVPLDGSMTTQMIRVNFKPIRVMMIWFINKMSIKSWLTDLEKKLNHQLSHILWICLRSLVWTMSTLTNSLSLLMMMISITLNYSNSSKISLMLAIQMLVQV